MYQLVTEIFDTLLPRACSGCGNQLSTDDNYICTKCILELNLADKARIDAEFQKDFQSSGSVTAFNSLYIFEKDRTIQNIIHAIKYRNKFRTGEYLGGIAGKQFSGLLKEWEIDFIVPVPLHRVKKSERGYNQSFYIAKGISKATGIPLKDNLIKRVKFTETQTSMTRKEREQNIARAFKCKKNIPSANYLLVDDVITTGSTISECAKEMLTNGAAKVYALSLAIAE